ncbi:carbon-nitrogen hydrolase family protein [Cytophaga sp. FL35]|uniref:carbon-nitrogen hydrolase family protein n=1 Tax=Cytophaga sp. FL35 TaxID=1904456 RepID=UPI0016537D48|nr:carbon-nitrogen hydrolase family protein [Cytophaga sp. FL35]MBC6998821.1 carbon-nitrogen hydrolase family protein [Cytophaga sp. FL35]
MKVKVGVVQDNPVFFDKEKTLDKLQKLVISYANQGHELLVFPESFIPGYPRGFTFGTKVGSRSEEGRTQYAKYYENSVDLGGRDLHRLETISKENNVYLIIGITEKQNTNGSLFCSMVYISPTNGYLGVHRKIKPTAAERVIWAEADGTSLVTYDTKIGKLGGLICWENYMPLARMAMFQKGIEVYIAPTADSRDNWIATLKHIALEGRCFVLGCNQYFTKEMYPKEYQDFPDEEESTISKGGSVIISPMGEIMDGPLLDQVGIVSAELDLNQVIRSKLDFDVIGHYAREDIFKLIVKHQPEMKKEP